MGIKIGDQVGSMSHDGTLRLDCHGLSSKPTTWRLPLNPDLSVKKPNMKLRPSQPIPVQAEHKCSACSIYFRIYFVISSLRRGQTELNVPLLIITKLASLLPSHATAASNDP
jgi:hypothetical protein